MSKAAPELAPIAASVLVPVGVGVGLQMTAEGVEEGNWGKAIVGPAYVAGGAFGASSMRARPPSRTIQVSPAEFTVEESSIRSGGASKGGGEHGLPLEGERPSSDMAGQESEYGCGLACVRELLRREGVNVTIEELAQAAKVDPEGPHLPEQLADALNAFHPRKTFSGGALSDPSAATNLSESIGLFAPQVQRMGHYSIVESVGSDSARISDPWGRSAPKPGAASEGKLPLDKYLELLGNTNFSGVFPTGTR